MSAPSPDRVPSAGPESVDDREIVVPALAEPHVHVDRAFSLHVTGSNESGSLDEARDRFLRSVEGMNEETLAPGATRLLLLLSQSGVECVRAHTAVGGELGFRAWDAVTRAASRVPQIHLQQVAMPVDPNLDHPEVAECLREAAVRGAVAVGGTPWLAEHPNRATEAAAGLASDLGLGLDLHVDETDDPAVDTLPVLASAVEESGLGGRAVAAHCCSMAGRPPSLAAREADALATAGVAVVVCPTSSLSLQGRTTGVRGLAPVRLLRDAGVTVGIGLDNVRDVVVSIGAADPLRMAWLLALAAHLTGEQDLAWLGGAVIENNRRICGLGESEGGRVGLAAPSLAEAVALVPARRWWIDRKGPPARGEDQPL